VPVGPNTAYLTHKTTPVNTVPHLSLLTALAQNFDIIFSFFLSLPISNLLQIPIGLVSKYIQKEVGGVAQWQNVSLACARPWVQPRHHKRRKTESNHSSPNPLLSRLAQTPLPLT
jgi:hypothetical protein